MTNTMSRVGILAFGSLISCPGLEIRPQIVERIDVKTPFPIEFARYSGKTRGGAPTLAPVRSGGASVKAKVLILKDGVTVDETTDKLWRRETGNECTGKRYPANRKASVVRIRSIKKFSGVETVLYADFYAKGKIREPKAKNLALRAIRSIVKAASGKDGVTYLIKVKGSGIDTPLMIEYETEVLRRLGGDSLDNVLAKLKKQ